MRRPQSILFLPALLLTLTALLAGCRQGSVAAGAVTVMPPATLAPSATPQPAEPSIPTATVLTDTSSTTDIVDDAGDDDADVQAVSALLQRKLPTFPARPLPGPTPNVGGPQGHAGAKAHPPRFCPRPRRNPMHRPQSRYDSPPTTGRPA